MQHGRSMLRHDRFLKRISLGTFSLNRLHVPHVHALANKVQWLSGSARDLSVSTSTKPSPGPRPQRPGGSVLKLTSRASTNPQKLRPGGNLQKLISLASQVEDRRRHQKNRTRLSRDSELRATTETCMLKPLKRFKPRTVNRPDAKNTTGNESHTLDLK